MLLLPLIFLTLVKVQSIYSECVKTEYPNDYRVGLLADPRDLMSDGSRNILIYYRVPKWQGDREVHLYLFDSDPEANNNTPRILYRTTVTKPNTHPYSKPEENWFEKVTDVTVKMSDMLRESYSRNCLPYYAALTDDTGKVLAKKCLRNEPTWMEDGKNYLGPQSIKNIFIPGTHGSGTHDLYNKGSIDFSFGSYKLISQESGALSQLINGARYLDIRVGYYPGDSQDEWWYNYGESYPTVALNTIISDVKKFLRNTKEIVIFDIHAFYHNIETGGRSSATSKSNHRKFIGYLKRQFEGLYLSRPANGWDITLDEIWASGKRLIISYDRDFMVRENDALWSSPRTFWNSDDEVENLLTSIDNFYKTAPRPNTVMAALTLPSDTNLANYGVRGMAWAANTDLAIRYNAKWGLQKANIVAVDFIHSSGIVDAAVEINKRFANRCN